jgi:hypothetical protein
MKIRRLLRLFYMGGRIQQTLRSCLCKLPDPREDSETKRKVLQRNNFRKLSLVNLKKFAKIKKKAIIYNIV